MNNHSWTTVNVGHTCANLKYCWFVTMVTNHKVWASAWVLNETLTRVLGKFASHGVITYHMILLHGDSNNSWWSLCSSNPPWKIQFHHPVSSVRNMLLLPLSQQDTNPAFVLSCRKGAINTLTHCAVMPIQRCAFRYVRVWHSPD